MVISKNYLGQYINVANTFIPLYHMILLHIKTMEINCVSCKKNIANKNSSVKKKTKKINARIKLCCMWQVKIELH